MDDKGNTLVVRGIPRKVTIREISSLQMKRYVHKGCNDVVLYVTNEKEKYNQLKIYDIQILKYFKDIFLEDIPVLPLKGDIESTIDLVVEVVPTSKTSYRMNIVNLTELKSQIHELIDKKYI